MITASSPLFTSSEMILDDVCSSLIRTLLYFDVFQYPLTETELYSLCPCSTASQKDIKNSLAELVQIGCIRETEGFYYCGQDDSIVALRKEKNTRAKKYRAPAIFFSRIIDLFPFTRAVFLSGSLSKNCMDITSDIDYFIITEPGRLWLNRTLLVMFKKLVLLNSYKFFCINYFITSDNLEIPDQNLYTAIEIAYLIPTRNAELYDTFMAKNIWIREYIPHFPPHDRNFLQPQKKSIFKSSLERLLSGSLGDKLDEWCYNLTVRNQRKKFAYLDEAEFASAMRSDKNVSTHHPQNFQTHVLRSLEEKYAEFEHTYNVRLL